MRACLRACTLASADLEDVRPWMPQVSVMTAGEDTQRFNSWAAEEQSMKQVGTCPAVSFPFSSHACAHTRRLMTETLCGDV
jgi:hypothetical protein